MVKYPEWTEELFSEEEIRNGEGWSVGIACNPYTDEEFKALVEHFDSRFEGEVRIYSFEEDFESYAHETFEDYPGNKSYYIKEYLTDNY